MEHIQKISIPQWVEMIQDGAEITVQTLLHGISMQPMIRMDRDPVTICPVRKPLQAADVILFTNGQKYIVHRIYKISPDGAMVQTLGDNCIHPDRPIPAEQVLGIAVHYYRNGKLHRLDTPAAHRWGKFWMAILPLRRPVMRLRNFAYRGMRFLKRRVLRVIRGNRNDN